MITVAGEALVDLVIEPDGAVTAALGGAPFNTAVAAGRLGAAVQFVGALSVDRFGGMLADRLADSGAALAARRSERPTTLAAAELDESGVASYRFYTDGTSAPDLAIDGVSAAPTDILFTGGLGLMLRPMADTIVQLVAERAPSTMVVFDINCRPNVIGDRDVYVEVVNQVLAESDLIKVSDDDLAYLHPDHDTLSAARRLLDVGGTAVLVTAGSKSTSIVTKEGVVEVPVPALSAPVVDSIGAGDTFGGGFLAWWSLSGRGRDHLDVEQIRLGIDAAHAAAGVVVTRRGADAPTRADLASDWL